jgi:hypothetical protein
MVVVCCHLSSLLFVSSISHVVFLKYEALKHTLFEVHSLKAYIYFLN